MKTISKILVVAVISSVVISCGGNEKPEGEESNVEVSAENLTVADYSIEGMVCAMGCAGTIEKEVASMDGVVESTVDYEAAKAHFEFDASIVTEKDIIAKIESIADGQYKVGEWIEDNNVEENPNSEGEQSEGSEETITEVSLPSFEIPNLFTLLMDQI